MIQLLAILAGLLSVLIWATQSSVSVLAIDQGWNSLDLTAARFCGSLLIALPWYWIIHKRGNRIEWKKLLLLSLFAGAPFTLINIAGLQFAPVTHAAAISLGMVPIITGLLSRTLLSQTVTTDQILALSLILSAVALIWFGTGISVAYLIGDICFLIGASLWALFAICIQRWKIPPTTATFYASLGSAPYLIWYFGFANWPKTDSAMITLQIVYQGLAVGIVALLLYGETIRRLGPQLATLFTAMVPVCVPIIAGFVIDYRTSSSEYFGLCLVIAAMLVAFYQPHKRMIKKQSSRL